MVEINISDFEEALSATLRRYLFTANVISGSEAELRREFWHELQKGDVFSREPLLSAIPAYEQAEPIARLLGSGPPPRLHPRLAALGAGGFSLNRALYSHQVESLRIAELGHNLVVATGTGSGKTECFLLPVLDDALRNPGPGVRTIVVYPLNALANDQLDRLRELLRELPEITFGRYTGDTPKDESGMTEEERRGRLCNERLTRQEIRAEPPHILLTNFAMLEYLLLRPEDNQIFRQQRLRYVVLDEAHTYSGAQGIDVGLLMRRLQEAYRNCQLQFLLTSATLGGGGEAVRGITGFAEKLTGKPFKPEHVLRGRTMKPSADQPPVPLATYAAAVPDEMAYQKWMSAIDKVETLRVLVSASGLPVRSGTLDELLPARLLYRWLAGNAETGRLHQLCSERPLSLAEAAERLFGDRSPEARRVTKWLVLLGAHAVEGENMAPLLPARYHLFFRGLRGGAVCLSPGCPGRAAHPHARWSRLVLEDRRRCPEPGCGALVLPLSTCAHCGMPAVRVYEDLSGRWQGSPTVQPQTVHLLTWLEPDEEDEDDSESDQAELRTLCVRCGALLGDPDSGCCESALRVKLRGLRTDRDGDGNLKKCPNCGGTAQPYPSVMRQMMTYEDAATAVLGEALIRALPPALPPDNVKKPAEGRRLLVFSDSRQRAAHYAPYLARTSAETQFMQPLLEAVEKVDGANDGQGATIDDIVVRFRRIIERQPFVTVRVTADDGECRTVVKSTANLIQQDFVDLKRECLITLLQHCTASPRRRDTLPALALAAVCVDLSRWQHEELRRRLPILFERDEQAGDAVIQHLLGFFLQRRILELPGGLVLRDLGPGPQQATCHYSEQRKVAGRQVYRWNAYEAPTRSRATAIRRNRSVGTLARGLCVDSGRDGERISAVLHDLWDALLELDVLKRLAFPSEFQLSYDRILLTCSRQWYICDRCGRFTVFPLGRLCPTPGCAGEVSACSAEQIERRLEDHHGYHRTRFAAPMPLEVLEHTAQLTNQVGRDYQHRFRSGDANVLSSSTTFELGVDVGTLKAVFLRNVPPTPANYIQRAGRAGRRLEGAAFAVTYARSLPHDQFHYFEQRDIVSGTVPVPCISLANARLTQRHVNAYLLAGYWRQLSRGAAAPATVQEFFLEPSLSDAPASGFGTWLRHCRAECRAGVERIIPAGCLSPDDALEQSVLGLRAVADNVTGRLGAYERQKSELGQERATAAPERLVAVARALVSLDRLIRQLRNERLIDFLASEHWLPGYAFPQDVVRLLVRQADFSERLRLERDSEYGISEYAPGSEIIADGKLFRSAGIDKQNRELEVQDYRACPVCRRVEHGTRSALRPGCPCGGGGGRLALPRPYVVPRGFTTMVDDPVPDAKLHRLKSPPNSEVFLIDGAAPDAFLKHHALRGVEYGYRRDGRLFRANRGRKNQQFRVCLTCGSLVAPGKRHDSPWGTHCHGHPQLVDLACTFDTDTLQIRFDEVGKPPPPVRDTRFWVSLQSAFLAAASEALGVPARDLDGTYRSQSETSPHAELIVYDRVPGGAGYVERIAQDLARVLRCAWDRTANCRNPLCDSSGSCYACLRTYGNQFQWDLLDRGRTAEWLRQFE